MMIALLLLMFLKIISSFHPSILIKSSSRLSTSMAGFSTTSSLKSFLQEQLRKYKEGEGSHYHLFLGNEASDADSIISAITFAYLSYLTPSSFLREINNNNHHNHNHHNNEHDIYQNENENENEKSFEVEYDGKEEKENVKTEDITYEEEDENERRRRSSVVYLPLISVPREDFPLRREVEILLEKVDLSWDDILSLEDIPITTRPFPSTVKTVHLTLLDHNQPHPDVIERLSPPPLLLPSSPSSPSSSHHHHDHDNSGSSGNGSGSYHFQIVGILDHHYDQHALLTLPSFQRQVAFDNEKKQAKVASTCTLITEYMEKLDTTVTITLPTTDCALLLAGVILLDTVNFRAEVNKATPRDVHAMKFLQSLLPSLQPDYLYDVLNRAKTDRSYWSSLSIRNALRFDWKIFPVGSNSDGNSGSNGKRIGIASVLMPLEDLLPDPSALQQAWRHATSQNVDLLVIMSIYEKNDHELVREIGVLSKDANVVQSLLKYLMTLDEDDNLALIELRRDRLAIPHSSPRHALHEKVVIEGWICKQGRVQFSRKQVAPILVDFMERQH